MNARRLGSRVHGAFIRRVSRWLGRRPVALRPTRPLISFTFDDFPRSALLTGGAILEQHALHGTYYVAMGLVNQTIATGDIFWRNDLDDLLSRSHELGCHTFDHSPAWESPPDAYESSVIRNVAALSALKQSICPQTHSYPISYPRPSTKRRLSRLFRACRFGGQTSNRGVVDLNALSSFFIEQSVHDFGAIERVIADNAARAGWLIFSTHDVTAAPTRYGCTPDSFDRIVRRARDSGAAILTMSEALDELGVPNIGL
jgi:peptidoglycan/xylan/chitin deacetylase (PgdA/CDA1 family)